MNLPKLCTEARPFALPNNANYFIMLITLSRLIFNNRAQCTIKLYYRE